jgi:hypothetical protein
MTQPSEVRPGKTFSSLPKHPLPRAFPPEVTGSARPLYARRRTPTGRSGCRRRATTFPFTVNLLRPSLAHCRTSTTARLSLTPRTFLATLDLMSQAFVPTLENVFGTSFATLRSRPPWPPFSQQPKGGTVVHTRTRRPIPLHVSGVLVSRGNLSMRPLPLILIGEVGWRRRGSMGRAVAGFACRVASPFEP